jgi:NAD(P) transhydrogenase
VGMRRWGTIPSKTFREAVRTLHQAQHVGTPGLRQKITMPQLLARVADVIQRETTVQADQLQRNDVAVILGAAAFRDPHTVTVETDVGGRMLSAAHFLIAVGTRPAEPRGVRPDGRTVILSDDLLVLQDVPRSMAVVGAGVIGIEYASMFAELGLEVTLVDMRERPLEFLDHEILDELVYQMRHKRVTFRLGEAVERLEMTDDGLPRGLIVLASGKRLVADVVLFCAGRQGATDALNLAAVGLAADDRGRLQVDDCFRTAVPHISAAGDVIGFPALAATSAEQGRLAACYMFGVEAGVMARHFPIGIYSIPEISMVGTTEQALTAEKVPCEIGLARYREIARGQILGDDTGLLKMIFHREDRRLLGVHAIGSGATELIHVGQAVLGLGGGLDYFLRTVFNYPTLAECYKVAALDAANKLYRTRRASLPSG